MTFINPRLDKKLLFSSLTLLLLGLGISFILTRPNKGSGEIPSSSPKTTTALSSSKSQASSEIPSSNPSSDTSSNKSSATTNTVAELKEPSGTFISNHHPGDDSPTAISSVCNTSPGATCYLQFTKGDVIKTLASQVADGNGSTFWNWDVQEAGFTSGSWKVTAIASLNGQTKSTPDPLNLEVK
jgi:hypothetical protein